MKCRKRRLKNGKSYKKKKNKRLFPGISSQKFEFSDDECQLCEKNDGYNNGKISAYLRSYWDDWNIIWQKGGGKTVVLGTEVGRNDS